MSARKRVRAYLRAPSILQQDPPDNELLARRWDSSATPATYDVRVSDLRALLRAERAARKQVQHLQAKNTVYVQRLKDWDALSPVTLSRWKTLQNSVAVQSQKAADATEKFRAAQAEAVRRGNRADALQAENATLRNTVAELSRKIQDPPGSPAWQELRADRDRYAALAQERQKQNRLLQKELDTLRAAPGTVNYRSMYESAYAKLIDANAELANELQEAKEIAAKYMRLHGERLSQRFSSEPGGLDAEDLRKLAQDLLPQFLATLLPPQKDKK